MLEPFFAIFMLLLSGEAYPNTTGTIEGVVLNGSRSGEPIAGAEVHLRAGLDGVFEPVEKTTTDAFGKFTFRELPLDSTIVFLPGANHQGVHYPGQRVRLDVVNKIAQATIVAYDVVTSVSPLTTELHEINVAAGEQLLEINERLIVSNRSRATYVGQSQDEKEPVTLRLSIPPNFDRVTFDREFYGRRFRIVDHQLVTDMPWPPGERELKFTYRVPLQESGGQICRPLDLPSSNVRVQAAGQGQRVSCNLSPAPAVGGRMIFEFKDKQLPSGYIIKVQIGDLPIPWMLYARWASLTMLVALVMGTFFVTRLRQGWFRIGNEAGGGNRVAGRQGFKVKQRAA